MVVSTTERLLKVLESSLTFWGVPRGSKEF